MQDDEGRGTKLVPLRTAARVYGVTKEALRRRVHRGELEHRTDNHGRLLAPLPANLAGEVGAEAAPKRRQGGVEEAPTVAALRRELAATREQVVRLEEQLAAAARQAAERARFEEEVKAELRRQAELARADLERERRRADEAERRQTEHDRRLDDMLRHFGELWEERRRPWPGLRRWWRRVIEGEDGG